MQFRQAFAGAGFVVMLAAAPSFAEDTIPQEVDYRAGALSFAALVNERYAYLDRLGGHFQLTPRLQQEAEEVHDNTTLLHFLERGVALLSDHHAITGSSFDDSWALVPSYSDIWIEERGEEYLVTSIRSDSPALGAVMPGDVVATIDGVPIAKAVAAFWTDMGLDSPDALHREYAARVLLAGRRDRDRVFSLRRAGKVISQALPSLYATRKGNRPPLTVTHDDATWRIRFNDSIGEDATIAAFDEAMAAIPDAAPVVLDLTDTASGGNSYIARAVIGWFIDAPRPYQIHSSPEEERQVGIPRMWVEYTLPRAGKHHAGPVTVQVDRWTGSMGEGLAVGLESMGFPVCGTRMAGLAGAVDDIRLERSGQVVKLPTERLTTVSGQPREEFQPLSLDDPACAAVR